MACWRKEPWPQQPWYWLICLQISEHCAVRIKMVWWLLPTIETAMICSITVKWVSWGIKALVTLCSTARPGKNKGNPKICICGPFCVGNSSVTRVFLPPNASRMETISMWWRHHEEWAVLFEALGWLGGSLRGVMGIVITKRAFIVRPRPWILLNRYRLVGGSLCRKVTLKQRTSASEGLPRFSELLLNFSGD